MRWCCQLLRQRRLIAGVVLLLVGLVLIVSALQRDDPECSWEQDLWVQIRQCDSSNTQAEDSALERTYPWWPLIVGLGAFVAGAYLLASGNTARPPDDADS
jgi:uncharacterized membrane protein HdeD (DUF308 family)